VIGDVTLDPYDVPPPDVERPHASRLDPGRSDFGDILAAHEQAVVAGEPGYIDPSTGLFVLTVEYLRARGHCCDQGCRHCPYLGAPEGP
jgi:hypothetical protein